MSCQRFAAYMVHVSRKMQKLYYTILHTIRRLPWNDYTLDKKCTKTIRNLHAVFATLSTR